MRNYGFLLKTKFQESHWSRKMISGLKITLTSRLLPLKMNLVKKSHPRRKSLLIRASGGAKSAHLSTQLRIGQISTIPTAKFAAIRT